MDYIFVDKMITVPIYKQIANSISDAIHQGQLKYNDKLPTEKEICRTFSISPTVVKMAYESLISSHMIKRIKGKGTFVTNRYHLQTPLNEFYQFEKKLSDSQIDHSYQTIMIDLIHYDTVAYRMLKLNKKEPCYLILRIIKANQNPVLFQKIYFPQKYFPNLENEFESSDQLFDFIEKKYGYAFKQMHNTFNPINASSDEALLLRINQDDAIYFVRSNMVDKKERVIAYVSSYFPGEFTEFEVLVHAI